MILHGATGSILLSIQLLGALYQYTDDHGTNQVVSDQALIPARFLQGAKRLDDDGAVLGDLSAPAPPRQDDRRALEQLKKNSAEPGIPQKNADQLLDELLDEETAGSAKRAITAVREADARAPSTWVTLAVALVLLVIGLRMLTGILRLAAIMAAIFAGALYVGDQFGDTPVGSTVKKTTDSLVNPIKKMQQQTGSSIAEPLKAPYEAIGKVKRAVESHQRAAEERNEILDKLSGD